MSVARQENGTIQISLSIPWKSIEAEFQAVASEMASSLTIPGFRKGKAPQDKVLSHIPKDTLVEKSLQKLLPKLFTQEITEHKINPAIYPKFELVKAEEGSDWQIMATTCELPEIKLGEYKKAVSGALAAKSLKRELTKDEKEQIAIDTLIDTVKFTLPELIIDEEVNIRLSSLLARIEKLGLNLDSYLASIGKNPNTLRDEYKSQAEKSLRLEILLTKIAQEEKFEPKKEEIDAFLKAAKADPNFGKDTEEEDQITTIKSILIKRKTIDMLSSL